MTISPLCTRQSHRPTPDPSIASLSFSSLSRNASSLCPELRDISDKPGDTRNFLSLDEWLGNYPAPVNTPGFVHHLKIVRAEYSSLGLF